LAEKILSTYKQQISSLELEPGTGGCFEVTAGDELVYSKLETGSFPDEQAVVDAIGKRLG